MTISNPLITVNMLPSDEGQQTDQRIILLTGQKVGGTATSGQLIEDILTEKEFNDYFGRTSQIARAGRALIKTLSVSSKRPKVYAIGLSDNGSGVAATGTVAFSGTATESGTLIVYVNNKKAAYELAIASGDTATDIGDALEAAITADLNSPVTASNSTGTVTLTAVNKGTAGNLIGIKYSGVVAGVSVTLTAMASGATNPSVTALFDAVEDKRITTVVYPYNLGISTLHAFTESRFNVDNKILAGVGLTVINDTYSNINSAADALNYKTLALIGNNKIASSTHKGGAIFEDPLVYAATIAGLRELRLTEGANLSSFAVNGITSGGAHYAAYPYHNLPVSSLPLIESGHDFTDEESVELINSGVWLFGNNSSNTTIISGSEVTTYKTNIIGDSDLSYRYLTYVDTDMFVQKFFFDGLRAAYPQHKLTTGKVAAGMPEVNKEAFISKMVSFYDILSKREYGYRLLREGLEERKAFKEALDNSVVITLANGKITGSTISNIVTQVREIVMNFKRSF